MSTALRSIDCSPLPTETPEPVLAAHVRTLERQIETLKRDLASARARSSTLVRELRRAVEAPTIVGQAVVGGVFTLTYSNGRVLRHEPTAEYSDDATEYGARWVEIAAPDTPFAVVEHALDPDAGEGHDPMFRTLAALALHGMAVDAGEDDR